MIDRSKLKRESDIAMHDPDRHRAICGARHAARRDAWQAGRDSGLSIGELAGRAARAIMGRH